MLWGDVMKEPREVRSDRVPVKLWHFARTLERARTTLERRTRLEQRSNNARTTQAPLEQRSNSARPLEQRSNDARTALNARTTLEQRPRLIKQLEQRSNDARTARNLIKYACETLAERTFEQSAVASYLLHLPSLPYS